MLRCGQNAFKCWRGQNGALGGFAVRPRPKSGATGTQPARGSDQLSRAHTKPQLLKNFFLAELSYRRGFVLARHPHRPRKGIFM